MKNDRSLADDIFICIFLNEISEICLKLLEFIHESPIYNKSPFFLGNCLVPSGNKSLSEPVLIKTPHWGRDKWPPFSKRHFQMPFLNENVWILIKISLKLVSKGPVTHYAGIVSDKGLAPTRWQAIIWTNDGLIPVDMHHSASMS